MSLDVYERLCPLSKFIKLLDDKNDLERYEGDDLLQEILKDENETLKTVGPILLKIYSTLFRWNEIKDQSCIYLNYWLDKKKELYLKSIPDIENSHWQLIEGLWNSLQYGNTYNTKCQRKYAKETIDKREKRINLMVYCKNRDHFKSKCDITRGKGHQYYCTNLPKYIEKHYNIFKTESDCLNIKDKVDDYSSYISKDCNLYDIHETFPQYDSFSGNILVNTNPRDSICKYVDNVATKESLEITDEEVPEASGEELISAPEPWASLPYVGLTFVGLFLSFLFMYRYTTLGSKLRSFIIRKNEARQFIEEQMEQDLLEKTLEYKTNNTESDDYTFSYQPLQN
ncbi:PIR Superfamily Protein [Plasmodium ovale wallikeri]|uniref:PIR Superfamily Protein n=1 Tax=Plasmodium ovale wallikeri TaxID=864142 RepID=A0A1A9ALG9_PLAOA|nr:PIR Superfamily Protein [Plasmodium ovale wallikeri]SBT59091.1 PIR Superfamily Protein [Plasmodium ovale wallikeri]